MRQENNKWQKRAGRGGFGVPNEYDHYVVSKPAPLLEWLLENVKSSSKTKIKQILQGRGIRVDGKTITKFDYPLRPGMKIAVSKSKKNQKTFKSKYLKIVYEDRYLVVVEKQIGILSMAAGHSSLNVKTVLDDYFHKTRQNCQAHVVHRLDRDTSGLMIYAKDKQTELALEDDWHHNVYDRRYVALVSGEMEEDEGTVANWLKDNKAYITYSSDTDNGGKYAVTHYHTLQRSTDYSLVEFKFSSIFVFFSLLVTVGISKSSLVVVSNELVTVFVLFVFVNDELLSFNSLPECLLQEVGIVPIKKYSSYVFGQPVFACLPVSAQTVTFTAPAGLLNFAFFRLE